MGRIIINKKKAQEEKEPKLVTTKELVLKRIKKNQWKLISSRLNYIDKESGDSSAWNPSSITSDCAGTISLADPVYRGLYNRDNDNIRPMVLLEENRVRLEELGFEISEDRLWATFKETPINI